MAEWLSLHIFEDGDLDALLTGPLIAAVRALQHEGHVGRWFFIRYWNGGPHIRCRLECTGETDPVHHRIAADLGLRVAGQARKRVGSEGYVDRARASATLERRLAANSGAALEEMEALQPAGTVQRRPFALDPLRFGGPERREQALSHFCVSSDIAAALLPEVRNRRGALHAVALHFATETARSLLLHGEDPQTPMTSLAAQLPAAEAAADRDWRDPETRPDLRDRVAAYLRAGPPLAFEGPHLNDRLTAWHREMTALGAHLRGPSGLMASVAIDYLHMLNNRLGLASFEEFYLYALLSRALAELPGAAPLAVSGRAA